MSSMKKAFKTSIQEKVVCRAEKSDEKAAVVFNLVSSSPLASMPFAQ